MSKYKVGDIVKVRDGLETLKEYGGLIYIEDMYGEALEIAAVGGCGTKNWYLVYEGQETPKVCSWFYSEEMFEGLASEPEIASGVAAAEESGRILFRLDESLNVIFMLVGSTTVCVPAETPIGIARKNPKDEECVEIGEALAYKRMMCSR